METDSSMRTDTSSSHGPVIPLEPSSDSGKSGILQVSSGTRRFLKCSKCGSDLEFTETVSDDGWEFVVVPCGACKETPRFCPGVPNEDGCLSVFAPKQCVGHFFMVLQKQITRFLKGSLSARNIPGNCFCRMKRASPRASPVEGRHEGRAQISA